MGDLFVPIMWQMLFLFAFIIIGFVLAKIKVMPDNSSTVLSKLENFIFVPALVMNTFIERGSVDALASSWKYIVGGAGITIVLIPIAYLIVKLCYKDKYLQNVTAYGLIFSNFGFMGNAVVSAIFPEIFFEYTMFTLPMWTLIYLWGVPTLLIGDGKRTTIKDRLKAFVNPMLIGMLIGLIIGLSGLVLPNAIGSVIKVSADCMSPVAMIFTGMVISKIKIMPLIKNWQLYVITFIRLAVFPLIFILIFAFVPQGNFLNETLLICAICALSMPMGLNAIVIPAAYSKDTTYPAGLLLSTCVLSIISIPLIFTLFSVVVI